MDTRTQITRASVTAVRVVALLKQSSGTPPNKIKSGSNRRHSHHYKWLQASPGAARSTFPSSGESQLVCLILLA